MIAQIPATISDEELRSAIREANLPTLLIVLTQLGEGDGLLDIDERPSRGTIDGTHRITEAGKANIRDRAFSVLTKLRDGIIQLPHLPDHGRLQQLAGLLVGESVAPEYIPMLLEDMGLSDYAEHAHQTEDDPPQTSTTEQFSQGKAVRA